MSNPMSGTEDLKSRPRLKVTNTMSHERSRAAKEIHAICKRVNIKAGTDITALIDIVEERNALRGEVELLLSAMDKKS